MTDTIVNLPVDPDEDLSDDKKKFDPPPPKPPDPPKPPKPKPDPSAPAPETYGGSRFTYQGSNTSFPALGTKGEKSLHDWHGDPETIIDALFKGVGNNGGGKFKEECEDNSGSVYGVGPKCSLLKEKAEQDVTRCFYENTIECVEVLREKIYFINTVQLKTHAHNLRERWSIFGSPFQSIGRPPRKPEYTSLDGFRREIKEAEAAYEDCLVEVEDKCECKRCIFTLEYPLPEDVDNEDEEPSDDTGDDPTNYDPPTREDNELTTASGFDVIPRVWGRYVVAGNIVWISEKRQTPDTAFVDMHIGLCVGRVAAVARVWFDDTLIYSGLAGIYSDLETAASTNGNTEDLSLSLGATVRVRLLNGSSSQPVSPLFAKRVGFGNVPAYRDLAVLEIENVDLLTFGGKFPEIRVEVLTKIEVVEDSSSSVAFPDIQNMWYSGRTESILVQDTDTLITLDADLAVREQYTDTGTFELLEGGFPLVRSPIDFLKQTAGILSPGAPAAFASRVELYVDGLIADNDSFYSYIDRAGGVACAYYTDTREVLSLVRYDYTHDLTIFSPFILESFNEPFPNLGGSLVSYGGFVHEGVRYYDQYRISGNNLNVSRHVIGDSFVEAYDSIRDAAHTNIRITDGALWGGDSTGVAFRFRVHSKADNTFIFGFRTDDGLVVTKVSPHSLVVLWSGLIEGVDVTGGLQLVPSLGQTFGFVSDASQAVIIDLITLEYAIKNITVTRAVGTKQFYDPRSQRIFFIDTTGRITRTSVDRTSPLRVSLAEIIKSLIDPYFLYVNVSALESITVDGYAATDGISARTFLEEIKTFFQISYAESDGLIVFTVPGNTSTGNLLAPFSEVSRSRFTNNSQLDSITVSFVEIDDTGMIASVQTVTDNLREDGALRELTYSLKINEDSETMRERAEKVLVLSRAQFNTVTFSTNWSNLAVNVGDRVNILGSDYIVKSTSLSPDYTLSGTGRIATLEDSAETASVGRDSRRIITQGETSPQSSYTPKIFFINSLSAEHSALSTNGKQIAYVGIEAPQDEIAETRVIFRTPPRSQRTADEFGADYAAQTINIPRSPRYFSREVRKSLHKGRIFDRPLHSGFATHTTFNPSDDLAVLFDKASSVVAVSNMRQYTDNPHEVLELAGENTLIVNSEIIKFASYEIINATTVKFTNLFRGNRGTDPYIQTQLSTYPKALVLNFLPDVVEGSSDTVYLYTQDTFSTIEVDSFYTKVPTRGELLLTSRLAAGFAPLVYYPRTSAGSARAWAPTSVVVFEPVAGSGDFAVKLKRREPLLFPNLQNNIAPDTRGTKRFLVQAVSSTFDLDLFESSIDYFKEPKFSFHTQEADGETLGNFTFRFESNPQRLLICGITRDGEGKFVTGHPLIIDVVNPLTP